MNERVVVSCPRCVRQYQIEPVTDRVVAQCGVCKAHFALIVPRLTGQEDGALVLEKEIEPYILFFRAGCEELARNTCELLRMAGGPITPENLRLIVDGLPRCSEDIASDQWRAGVFSRVLKLAFDCGQDEEKFQRLADYFLHYIPSRSSYALDMLQGAFAGVLGGIDWPPPVDASPAAEVTPKADCPDGSGTSTTPLPPRLKRFSWLTGNS